METLEKTKVEETTTETQLNPSKIMEVGMAFMASKTLLTAVNLDLFTLLAVGELSAGEIQKELGLHNRSVFDFLDALVALGFLKRTGLNESAMYSNTDECDLFLDKHKDSYIGGILRMANNRLYGFWNDLEEGLKTGLPQNESKINGKGVFESLYADKERLTEFIAAMGGVQMGNFIAFANKFNFNGFDTLCDIGGAGALLSAQVSINNPNVKCTSFDLPPVSDIARINLENMGLQNRVSIESGDFFNDEFPKADVITMGNILHDWGLKDKKMLIKKAYDALPNGGAFVVIENIIDDSRSKNTFGLLMSLCMLIETPGGFDYSAADINVWVEEAGFSETYMIPLTGPTSAFVAIK